MIKNVVSALQVDPIRTMSAGKVDLGAFRTYPKGYKPADEGPSEYQSIPLNKIEDFGVHCKQVRCSLPQKMNSCYFLRWLAGKFSSEWFGGLECEYWVLLFQIRWSSFISLPFTVKFFTSKISLRDWESWILELGGWSQVLLDFDYSFDDEFLSFANSRVQIFCNDCIPEQSGRCLIFIAL